jgi:hypothetical protein
MYIISKCWLVAWLVGDHLMLRDFCPYVIIFMNVRVVITVAVVMLLRDFGSYICWLVGDRLPLALWDKIYDVCVVIIVAMVMLLRDFWPYGIIFMTVCLLL